MERLLRTVEVVYESLESTLEMQGYSPRLDPAKIAQHQGDAAVQKGELTQPVLKGRKIELGLAEGLGARQKGDLGASDLTLTDRICRPGGGRPDFSERRLGDTVAKPHEPFRPAAVDAQIEPRRQTIDDRDSHAVQTARHLVSVLIEFSAGVQVGHDDLGGGYALFVVDADRDAAAIVGDGAGAVGIQRHGYGIAIAGERLVNGVVDDLVDH